MMGLALQVVFYAAPIVYPLGSGGRISCAPSLK